MTAKTPHTTNNKSKDFTGIPRSVLAAMLLAVISCFIFVKPYFGTILFSALVAFIFNPVYKAVYRKTKRSGLAVLSTIIIALLSFIVPAALVIGVTVSQASELVSKFNEGTASLGPQQLQSMIDSGTERINNIVHVIPGGERVNIDKQEISERIQSAASDFAKGFVDFIKSASGAFIGFITTTILALFLISAMLSRQKELIDFVKTISPFQSNLTNRYLERAGAMTKAMVKGQLIVATAQGFASALSLWLVGVDYFWFFFVILTFLSFIPLGGGILTIPIGIIIMLTGNIGRGLFVLLWHFLVVTNIDNFLRPRLVPHNAQLNPALLLLAVFSGLVVFGGMGVIYGPVIMILIVTTFQMYAEHASKADNIEA
jgi:predicted PurR-regulated permease PerM